MASKDGQHLHVDLKMSIFIQNEATSYHQLQHKLKQCRPVWTTDDRGMYCQYEIEMLRFDVSHWKQGVLLEETYARIVMENSTITPIEQTSTTGSS